jgi:hypothetical protein
MDLLLESIVGKFEPDAAPVAGKIRNDDPVTPQC